jgi:hypothetical protein
MMRSFIERTSVSLALVLASAGASGCIPQPRAAVSLKVSAAPKTPSDAVVTIDEQYVGPLAFVAAHGVRLPEGRHRISVERPGYFPFDVDVTAEGTDPIQLQVAMVPIPD